MLQQQMVMSVLKGGSLVTNHVQRMVSFTSKRNQQNDRPGAAYLTRASEVLGQAKVQHEELLLKIEVCTEELREYLGKSAVSDPKELFESN